MKKFLFTALGLACLINSYCQVIDPRKLKKPNVPGVPDIPIQKESLLDPLTLQTYYINGNGFWGVNTHTKQVLTDQCVSANNLFQWQFTKNTDGSFSITSLSNNTPKMVYKRSNVRLPGPTGLSGDPSHFDGHYVQFASERSSAAYTVIDKWWFRKVNEREYWLVPDDRRDSAYIHLYTTTEVNTVNFDLSSLNGWVTEGGGTNNAFAGQPSGINLIPFFTSPVIPAMPLGGSYWRGLEDKFFAVSINTDNGFINTARPGNNRWAAPDETKTGVLTSLPFVMCGEKILYKIAGTQDEANIKVEFLEKRLTNEPGAVTLPDGYYKIISTTTGHNNDIARKIVVNAAAQKSKVCRFRITDNSAAGHIIVDDIDITFTGQISSAPVPPTPVIPTAKPIWGSIDMHTHPMSYMGMGGKLMHGQLDGNPAVALGNCNCTHGGWGTDNGCGNFLRAEIVNMVDEHNTGSIFRYDLKDIKVPHSDHKHDGYPNLVYWPTQQTMIHQQMWWEWLKRAKDGGLTAIIALTVNSEVLGRALGGDAPFDDKKVADRQIDSLISFVRRHRDFLDTVTSAARMRRVINSGRMAVIIGMEVDNLGNFYENVPVSNEQIRAEIARLKTKGVRYLFPIHVTDNKFGGSAVYKELFNFSNKYVTAQPITGSVPVEAYPPILPGHLYNVEAVPDTSKVTFRLDGSTLEIVSKLRPLVDFIELGGFPILPPPLDLPSLAIKPFVDPIIFSLRASQQYQLAKKIFLDVNSPQWTTYNRIPGGQRNVLGMSDQGTFAVTEMMRQGMLIDVDHASERSVHNMIDIARANNNYPLNSGHNGLRGRADNEKTRTVNQLTAIKALGGMFGMGWEGQNPVQFNFNYKKHMDIMGANTAFGSDIDGYATTPEKPAAANQFINYTNRAQNDFLQQYTMAGSPREWNYNKGGMAHIGLIPDFFESLKKAGASYEQLKNLFFSAEQFAQMWEKCEGTAPMITR